MPPRDAAVAWLVLRDGGRLAAADEAAFAAWLKADPAHARAYAEARRVWSDMGRIAQPANGRLRPARRFRAWRIGAAFAAAAVMAAIAVAFDLPLRLEADARTGIGEIAAVGLPDGSTATLGTASAIAFDFDAGRRRVRLLRGEAVFHVAGGSAVPFDVEAGDGRTRAEGTIFAVRRGAEEVAVTVLESRVCVTYPSGAASGRRAAAGQRVRYSPAGGLGAAEPVDAAAATAWTRHKLIFADRPLGSVVEELNRYHAGAIRIIDPAIRDRRVSGVFDLSDPLAVVDLLADTLGIHSLRLTRFVVLLYR